MKIKLLLKEEYKEIVFKELIEFEGKTSDKCITYSFEIDEYELTVNGDDVNTLIRTVKWIDDIIDKSLREIKGEFKMIINQDGDTKDIDNVRWFNPSDEVIKYIEESSQIKEFKIEKNWIDFTFDFYSELAWSKRINLNTKRGVVNFQAVEVRSHNKLFSIYSLGDLTGSVDTRIHYICETSEIFGSVHCDCREQMENFFDMMFKNKKGLFIYAHEEGRGLGLFNKVNAYYNTEHYGDSTVEAMIKETGRAEARMFEIPADIIQQLGIKEVNLWTNNPLKIDPVTSRGIKVNRKAAWYELDSKEANKYVKEKVKEMRHIDENTN